MFVHFQNTFKMMVPSKCLIAGISATIQISQYTHTNIFIHSFTHSLTYKTTHSLLSFLFSLALSRTHPHTLTHKHHSHTQWLRAVAVSVVDCNEPWRREQSMLSVVVFTLSTLTQTQQHTHTHTFTCKHSFSASLSLPLSVLCVQMEGGH